VILLNPMLYEVVLTCSHSTVVGMAQDFVGSNNINLLVPLGQFGTRLAGGRDAASARYIFTHLSPVARCLFPEEDDALLKYREDDGQLIEPEFYCPIIPLLLVNGAAGIGTGWSTSIPQHNPRDVVEFVRAKLDSLNELPSIHPWAKGFTGEILWNKKSSGFTSFGVVTAIDSKTVKISELPLGTWTSDYKKLLLKMRDKGDILSFVEDHTTATVSFAITLQPEKLEKMMEKGLHKTFKLESSLNTTNMNAFNANNVIQKFDSAESIAEAHFPVRQSLYHDRKSVLASEMNYKATMLRNKARFIVAVADGNMELMGTPRKTRAETIAKLQELEFDDKSQLEEIRNKNVVTARCLVESAVDEVDENEAGVDFDYLLNMPLSSLTSEKIDSLYKDAEDKESELATLHKTAPEDLWRADLDKLELYL
jgi:DNA topoisomerase II